ncbi:MAG TPA: DedA family protein [Thermodesulfovibrionales bacterium]|nr:DedA family protein [Thermodesulfovibrionales bacterium]
MELLSNFIQIFLHLDQHLDLIIRNYGTWTYAILFLIIFCETGLVVTPILPGDSLLFAAGTFAAVGSLEVASLVALLSVAAVAGNTVNYWIGHFVGPKVFHKEKVRLLNKEYLDRARRFYEKHGGKTIVVARFLPIIRTFAPFVAGIGSMNHWKFSIYNVTAGIAWVCVFVFGGYYFGNLPAVKQNFTFVILAIIIISLLPAVIEFLRHRRQSV